MNPQYKCYTCLTGTHTFTVMIYISTVKGMWKCYFNIQDVICDEKKSNISFHSNMHVWFLRNTCYTSCSIMKKYIHRNLSWFPSSKRLIHIQHTDTFQGNFQPINQPEALSQPNVSMSIYIHPLLIIMRRNYVIKICRMPMINKMQWHENLILNIISESPKKFIKILTWVTSCDQQNLIQLICTVLTKSRSVMYTGWALNSSSTGQNGRHSNAFSWLKTFVFGLKFQWILFLGVQLTINQHWFR